MAQSIATVRLHPATCALNCFRQVATDLLTAHAFSQHEDTWYLMRWKLDTIAVPSLAQDMESVVRWNPDMEVFTLPEDPAVTTSKTRMDRAMEVRKFLRAFVDATGLRAFKTFEDLEMFYYLWCNFLLVHLLETGGTVDLIFARLFASPLRGAWQERVRDALSHCGLSKKDVAKSIFLSGRRLIGEDGLEGRWLELVLDQSWRETVRRMERRKRDACRDEFQYRQFANDRLKKIIPLLLENFDVFRKQPVRNVQIKGASLDKNGMLQKTKPEPTIKQQRDKRLTKIKNWNKVLKMVDNADVAVDLPQSLQEKQWSLMTDFVALGVVAPKERRKRQ